MDFYSEFFPLLNKIVFKQETNVPTENVTTSDIFLYDRYVSFAHELFSPIINQTINKYLLSFSDQNSGEMLFQLIETLIPKMPKKRINYIKKENKVSKTTDTEDFIKKYARRHNISERKVWDMFYTYTTINENNI